ncbi:hypothetical protein cyc_00367 [Cyclospora cayetanensis]|uniref:Uncharacterized protein n=1 Tax=Cyclospora cayetanensis TaxID=88456 RepID=A0A1D3CXR3_9EIME|nr:hypothetical protein cyc_00367 [Cyclospora cayetanensis]
MFDERAPGLEGPSKGHPDGKPSAKGSSEPEVLARGESQELPLSSKGKGRKVRFHKNNPNTFTFKLLPMSQHQLRQEVEAKQGRQRIRMQLQRVIPPNAKNKPLQPLPEYLQRQIDQQQAAAEEATEGLPKRRVEADLFLLPSTRVFDLLPPLVSLFCRDSWRSVPNAMRMYVWEGPLWSGQSFEQLVFPFPPSFATLRGRCFDSSLLQQHSFLLLRVPQSGDCYFPQDGYDYSQHLVSLGGGTFLPHAGGEEVIAEEEQATATGMREDKEACEVLDALEASDDGYEEIADDFVASAVADTGGKQWTPNEKELLWGSRPPLLPPAVGDRLFGGVGEEDSEESDESGGSWTGCSEDEAESQVGEDRVAKYRAAAVDNTQAQKLEQLLEEYREECIGELDPEEVEESDSFSDYEECFDAFLKSQERPQGVEASKLSGEHDELRAKTLALARLQEEEGEKAPLHAEPLLPARARPTWDGETIISARSGLSVQPRSIILGSSRATKMMLAPCLALDSDVPGTKGAQEPRRAQLPPTPEDAETVAELPEHATPVKGHLLFCVSLCLHRSVRIGPVGKHQRSERSERRL